MVRSTRRRLHQVWTAHSLSMFQYGETGTTDLSTRGMQFFEVLELMNLTSAKRRKKENNVQELVVYIM